MMTTGYHLRNRLMAEKMLLICLVKSFQKTHRLIPGLSLKTEILAEKHLP